MIPAFRAAIIGLLALAQLFAPLVHAHAGGGYQSGGIHVPGLEFLAKRTESFAQSPAEKGSTEVIVGMAPGFKDRLGHLIPAPDPLAMPPLRAWLAFDAASARTGSSISPPTPALTPIIVPAQPRAPPGD